MAPSSSSDWTGLGHSEASWSNLDTSGYSVELQSVVLLVRDGLAKDQFSWRREWVNFTHHTRSCGVNPGCPLACHRAHRFGGGEGKKERVRRRFVWRQLGSSCTSGGAGTESGHGSSGSGRLARGVVSLGVGVCSLDWQQALSAVTSLLAASRESLFGSSRATLVTESPWKVCASEPVQWSAGIWVGSVDQKPHVKCKTVYSHVAVRTSHNGLLSPMVMVGEYLSADPACARFRVSQS